MQSIMRSIHILFNNFITNGIEIIASQHKDVDAEFALIIQQNRSSKAGEYSFV